MAFLVVLASILTIIYVTPLGERLSNWSAWAGFFIDDSPRSLTLFTALSALLILCGIPRLMFFTLGGYVFGFWIGLGASVGAILIGSWLAFRIARACGRAWLSERLSKHPQFGRIIAAKPSIGAIAILRLLPVSNALINAGLAVGRVNDRTFLMGSLLGFLPYGVLAVLIGCGLAEADSMKTLTWAGGAASVLVIVIWSIRRWRS